MKEVSIVIPNYNGIQFLPDCLGALLRQRTEEMEIVVVDNGSADGSLAYLEKFPELEVVSLEKNLGFCGAVNLGIRKAQGSYVILLNNDTEVSENFVSMLVKKIKEDDKIFSCSSKMVQFHDRGRMDDGGDYYCALGWAFARGKGGPVERYETSVDVFASCAGAAIYRKKLLEQLGLFDEKHFAYLEDIDLGYRARIFGYRNVYAPEAVVYHVGSGSSGSVHNAFKVKLSSRNSVYLIYKNMPVLQIVLNSPFLLAGFLLKYLFFCRKGLGGEYRRGLLEGFSLCTQGDKVKFRWKNLPNYGRIQLELWMNLGRRLKRN